MDKSTLFAQHKKMFLVLAIIESCSVLIMAISLLFLPIASYNLTKLETTKVSFNFFELIETNPLLVLGFFLLCISVVPGVVNKAFIQKDTWKDKIKIMLLLTLASVVMFVIGAVAFNFSIMEYVEPNTGASIILKMEIGAYLFWLGLLSVAIGVYEVVCLKLILNGKYTEEQLFGNEIAKNDTIINTTIQEKLIELQMLKKSEVITEDEYSQKKKELVDKFIE